MKKRIIYAEPQHVSEPATSQEIIGLEAVRAGAASYLRVLLQDDLGRTSSRDWRGEVACAIIESFNEEVSMEDRLFDLIAASDAAFAAATRVVVEPAAVEPPVEEPTP